jgi:hypothetical protein
LYHIVSSRLLKDTPQSTADVRTASLRVTDSSLARYAFSEPLKSSPDDLRARNPGKDFR